MFNLDVKSLFNISVTNDLVANNTNSGFSDVVNNTSLTVVEFEWHTVVDSTVNLDVNNVTDLVSLQVGGHSWSTMLLEVTTESVTSSRSQTMTVIIEV